MNILIISNIRHGKSGITVQICNLSEKLREETHTVVNVSTHGSILGRFLGVVKSLFKAVRSDIIIGAGSGFYGFFPIVVASSVAFITRKSVIFNYHGGQVKDFLEKSEKFIRFFVRKKTIVVASEYIYKVFREYSFNAKLIPNFFDFDSFPPAKERFVWNGKIVWSRSFEAIYQPELALNAALKTLERRDCEFHFYGNGSMYERLKNQFKHPGIKFHGLVPRDEVLKSMSESSVFLNTTIYDNMPNSFSEAGFYGLLVVSTKVGGIATTFNDTEIVFAKENTEVAFSDLLFEVLDKPDKYDSLRKNFHDKVINFNWENIRDEWLNLLEETVKNKKKN